MESSARTKIVKVFVSFTRVIFVAPAIHSLVCAIYPSSPLNPLRSYADMYVLNFRGVVKIFCESAADWCIFTMIVVQTYCLITEFLIGTMFLMFAQNVAYR